MRKHMFCLWLALVAVICSGELVPGFPQWNITCLRAATSSAKPTSMTIAYDDGTPKASIQSSVTGSNCPLLTTDNINFEETFSIDAGSVDLTRCAISTSAVGAKTEMFSLDLRIDALPGGEDERWIVGCEFGKGNEKNIINPVVTQLTINGSELVTINTTLNFLDNNYLSVLDATDTVITTAAVGDFVKLSAEFVQATNTSCVEGIRVLGCDLSVQSGHAITVALTDAVTGCGDGLLLDTTSGFTPNTSLLAETGLFSLIKFTENETVHFSCNVHFCLSPADTSCFPASHCQPARRKREAEVIQITDHRVLKAPCPHVGVFSIEENAAMVICGVLAFTLIILITTALAYMRMLRYEPNQHMRKSTKRVSIYWIIGQNLWSTDQA